MTRKTISLTAAVATALLLGPATSAYATPEAAGAQPQSTSADHGDGLAQFQKAHGLKPTGRINASTSKTLHAAPDAEVAKYFKTAEDLDPTQREHARIVIGVGKGAGFSDQGQVIALMTAMQESKFVNYTEPVDHDSLGIFQQRPSMGWGTPEQITHVPTSSKSFYGVAPFGSNPGLKQINGWETMPPGEAAQAVQRSAYPDRYAQWEGFARDFLAAEGPTVEPIP